MFLEPKMIAEGGMLIARHQEKIRPLLRKLRNRLKHGRISIAVFGPGGTGKTTLGNWLSGEPRLRPKQTYYETSLGPETFDLHGELTARIQVVPGQEYLREPHWSALRRTISAGKVRLVINVVNWGYHAFEQHSYREHSDFEQDMEIEAFMQKYTEQRREDERKVIQELTPCLKDVEGNLRMITLVTKQDLWWPHREEVQKHYEQGTYNDFIQEVYRSKGEKNFRHVYHSASLHTQSMKTPLGELLMPNAAGYDELILTAHLSRLLQLINELATH